MERHRCHRRRRSAATRTRYVVDVIDVLHVIDRKRPRDRRSERVGTHAASREPAATTSGAAPRRIASRLTATSADGRGCRPRRVRGPGQPVATDRRDRLTILGPHVVSVVGTYRVPLSGTAPRVADMSSTEIPSVRRSLGPTTGHSGPLCQPELTFRRDRPRLPAASDRAWRRRPGVSGRVLCRAGASRPRRPRSRPGARRTGDASGALEVERRLRRRPAVVRRLATACPSDPRSQRTPVVAHSLLVDHVLASRSVGDISSLRSLDACRG